MRHSHRVSRQRRPSRVASTACPPEVGAEGSSTFSVGTDVVRPSATTTTPSVAANVKAIDPLTPSPPRPGQAPWSGQSSSSSRAVMVSTNQYMSFSPSGPRPPQVNLLGVSPMPGSRGTRCSGDGSSISER